MELADFLRVVAGLCQHLVRVFAEVGRHGGRWKRCLGDVERRADEVDGLPPGFQHTADEAMVCREVGAAPGIDRLVVIADDARKDWATALDYISRGKVYTSN